jgi:CheY-like chemotaxis protein
MNLPRRRAGPPAPDAPEDAILANADRFQGNGFSPEATLQMERLVGDLRSIYVQQKVRSPSPSSQRKKILIVDDQEEIRRLIRMSVQLEDYEVFEADTGDTGLAKALEIKPDLVVLDVMMPGALDGLHVCRAIKAGPTPTRVLLLTALGGRSRMAAAQKAGADAYLLKPFSPLQLIDVINQLLETE